MVNPDSYEKNKTISKAILDQHLPTLLSLLDWKQNDIVVDYGCGAGIVALKEILPIAQDYGAEKLIGVDVSPEMVHYAVEASKKIEEGEIKIPVEFLVANIMDESSWPLMDVKFDRVFCLNVLQFIQDYKGFLAKVYEQLNERGQFALIVPFSKNSFVFEKLVNYPRREGGEEKFTSPYKANWTMDPDLVEKLLRDSIDESKFSLEHFELADVTYTFPDATGPVKQIRCFVNTADLSPEENERLDKFMMENVCIMYNQSADTKPFVVTIKTSRIILRK